MAVQRLTAAYRSRPRPSSTPGAKASTVNSYYLDGERLTHSKVCESNSLNTLKIHVTWILKTKFTDVNSDFGLVQFSRSTEAHLRVLQRWSLKTEQRPTSARLMRSPVDVLEKSP
jgi:hypothetical protein